jgi:hypothetical protein
MKFQRPAWFRVRITALHWHYAGMVLLLVANGMLLTHVVMAWQRVRAGDVVQLQQHEADYKAMQLKTRPLRGLDKKIEVAKAGQSAFYKDRFPENYSTVAAELGVLASKNNVLLSRVQYAQGKPKEDLYEVRMDASLSGDYAPIVRFLNGLERDKIFFLINSIALSGQQNGVVNLRLSLTTYLHAPVAHLGAPQPTPTAKEAQ